MELLTRARNFIATKGCKIALIAAPLALASAASAGNLDPACTPGTLTQYIGLSQSGGGCSIGILQFTEFGFASDPTSADIVYNASQIEVTPTVGGFQFSTNVVSNCLDNSGNVGCFQLGQGKVIYDIRYQLTIDPGPQGTSADLGMDPPFGNVMINQYYCADSFLVQTDPGSTPFCSSGTYQLPAPGSVSGAQSQTVQVLGVNNSNPPASRNTGIVTLNPPIQSFAQTLYMIDLDATQMHSGFDGVAGNTFVSANSPTPEPSTFLIAAGGLAALGLRLRRRRA